MPATFNVIFEGVTPSPAREAAAKAILYAEPERVFMPAAGRFGATEALVRAGYPSDLVYCSDISLFSSLIGYLADPRLDFNDLNLRFTGDGILFAENTDVDDPFDMAATALIAVKHEQLNPKHQYAMNLRRELRSKVDHYRERLVNELRELVEGLGPIHYQIADLRSIPDGALADGKAAYYVNPPGYSVSSYDKMLGATTVEWDLRFVPDEVWDKVALRKLYSDLTGVDMLAILYSIDGQELPPFGWQRLLAVSRKGGRTDYLVANRPLPYRHVEVVHTQRAGGKPMLFEVYADQEITEDSVLEFVEIDRPTVMYYRDLFVHRLGTTQSEWYIAMLVDGRLVTVIGLNRQRFMHFKSGYVKETFGISVTSQRYKRIGRLFMLALTTTAFRDWMRKHGRYGIREMLGIETTSLTKHEVSKNDRALMKLVSREKLPNGTWKLQYRADLRDETFHDVLVKWLATEAQHSRSGPKVEAQQEPQGRRARRAARRAERQEVAGG